MKETVVDSTRLLYIDLDINVDVDYLILYRLYMPNDYRVGVFSTLPHVRVCCVKQSYMNLVIFSPQVVLRLLISFISFYHHH